MGPRIVLVQWCTINMLNKRIINLINNINNNNYNQIFHGLIYRHLVGNLKLFYKSDKACFNMISIKQQWSKIALEPIFSISMVCSSKQIYGRISLTWWEWKILRFPDADGFAWILKLRVCFGSSVLLPVPGNKFRC